MSNSELILLVEDDPADSRLLQRAFTKAEVPARVLRLTNGEEAIGYLAGETPYENRALYPFPDLLILDLKLPRRSGFEVLEWIRRRTDSARRLPVVMLTSSNHSVDVNRAYDLGVNSYLVKPETSQELLNLATTFKDYWLKFNEMPLMAEARKRA